MKPIRLRRGHMVLAPPTSVRNIHLITQDIPHSTGLLTGCKRLPNRHAAQRGKLLVTGKAPPVGMTKHLIDKLPEFTLTHKAPL